MKSREENFKIAKEAFKAIESVIAGLQSNAEYNRDVCWDQFIEVDDELFHASELTET